MRRAAFFDGSGFDGVGLIGGMGAAGATYCRRCGVRSQGSTVRASQLHGLSLSAAAPVFKAPMMHLFRIGAVSIVLGTLAAPSVAQGRHEFVVDSSASNFMFSGSVFFNGLGGMLVGQPATFNASGAAAADITVVGGVVTAGEFVPGIDSVVDVPALTAIVPAPVPFLPPVATINVSASELVFTSAAFAVQPGGGFTALVSAEILSGVATVGGLTTGTVDLAGAISSPTSVTGTIVPSADGLDISVPINTIFPFTDPVSGASGTLALNGAITASDRSLAVDTDSISMAVGGVQTMTLSAGTAHAGARYYMLGSATGTSPGFTANGVQIPLIVDGWLLQTIASPNVFPLAGSLGNLDAIGTGTTTFTLPALPLLAGLSFDHAYITLDATLQPVFASVPVPLSLVP